MKWSCVYKKAYNDDGSLFFPEKLSHEFLEETKHTMGSYIFANQYLNEIIPADKQVFKKDWFKYYDEVPSNVYNFAYVDPALSEADGSDNTGVVVVSVDSNKDWYIKYARRYRITPTEIVDLLFKIQKQFNCQVIGVEAVAFQKALLYFLGEEMRRRKIQLPVTPVVPPTNKTKAARILALVPRMEWGHCYFNRGLVDLETEFLQFPRGAHDDLIDAAASIEQIFYAPPPEPEWKTKPAANHPDYEKWFIQQMHKPKHARDLDE